MSWRLLAFLCWKEMRGNRLFQEFIVFISYVQAGFLIRQLLWRRKICAAAQRLLFWAILVQVLYFPARTPLQLAVYLTSHCFDEPVKPFYEFFFAWLLKKCLLFFCQKCDISSVCFSTSLENTISACVESFKLPIFSDLFLRAPKNLGLAYLAKL